MKKENIIDLTKILKPYANKRLWVALDSTYSKVYGSGETILEVIEECKKNGIKKPFIIRAEENYSGIAPSLI